MGSSQTCRWHEFDNRISFEQSAINIILESAEQAIVARGLFRIVLAGGNTPRNIYRTLCSANAKWSAWHIYFGDERCLPAGHPERNSSMARAEWLDHVAIPLRQIHMIPGELGPDKAALNYGLELAGMDKFDLVLLGLGEDGHTASLFPGGAWEHQSPLAAVIPVHDAPKPPAQRVSLSPERLGQASRVVYLVNGMGKREAVMDWRAGVAIPASKIRPPAGVDVFLYLGGEIPVT
ncbi:MAG: 6-phosphogluconolactonase [Gallionella sp.]